MGRPFRAEKAGVRVDLDVHERELLGHLLDQVAELLDPGDGDRGPVDPLAAALGLDPVELSDPTRDDGAPGRAPPPPQDPALARLLPQAHRDDTDVAAEFRRLTEYGLRTRKRDSLQLAGAALRRADAPVLTREEAQALVKGLTDVRLVIGERLGLRDDEDADRLQDLVLREDGDGPDPWTGLAAVYDLLTWWQEHLVAALRPPTGRSWRPGR